MTANSAALWFTGSLALLLAVCLVAVFWPRADRGNPPGQEVPAAPRHAHPRHARQTAGQPAAAQLVPPQPAGPGTAGQPPGDLPSPAASGPPASGRPPWQPAPAPSPAELILSTAGQLTRLLYGWKPNTRLSADQETAAALTDLRAAIDASLLRGYHQR